MNTMKRTLMAIAVGCMGMISLADESPATISTDDESVTIVNNGPYTIYKFKKSASFTVETSGYADVLLVGGGGAGGATMAAGGGAGGFLQIPGQYLQAGRYDVVVGKGGQPGGEDVPGGSGGNSSISIGGLVAYGGGGGASWSSNQGLTGGSGGGSRTGDTNAGVEGQGNAGGRAYGNTPGGGGGAGKAGGNGNPSANVGGEGGRGLPSDYSGEVMYYAGGGGAGSGDAYWVEMSSTLGGAGGLGGGGAGSNGDSGLPGGDGVDGLGGGGGGGSYTPATAGGKGGDGVVIVRVRNPDYEGTDPVVSVYGCDNATQTGARLLWSVIDAGDSDESLTVKVRYGTSADSLSVEATLAEGAAVYGPVTGRISGLTAGTTYHAQMFCVKSDSSEVDVGDAFQFTTASGDISGENADFYWNPAVSEGRWDDYRSWVDGNGDDLDPLFGYPDSVNCRAHFSLCGTDPIIVTLGANVSVQYITFTGPVNLMFRSVSGLESNPVIYSEFWDYAFHFAQTSAGSRLVFDGVDCSVTAMLIPSQNTTVSFEGGARHVNRREILIQNPGAKIIVGEDSTLSMGDYLEWFDSGPHIESVDGRIVISNGTFDTSVYSLRMGEYAGVSESTVDFFGDHPSLRTPNVWAFKPDGTSDADREASVVRFLFHVDGPYAAAPVMRNATGCQRATWYDIAGMTEAELIAVRMSRDEPKCSDYSMLYENTMPLRIEIASDSAALSGERHFRTPLIEWENGILADKMVLADAPNPRYAQLYYTYGWSNGHTTNRTVPSDASEKPTGVWARFGKPGFSIIVR